MRWKRQKVAFYPYIMQVGGNKEILYVNYAMDVAEAVRDFLQRHTQIRNSQLRADLFDANLYFTSSKQAERASLRLIRDLEMRGYEVIAGGPLHNHYWQVYVIEIDGDPQHLYVGETNYPVEKRFQQHIYKFNPARVLLKYDSFELAMQHVAHLPSYRNKQASLAAEAATAKQLRNRGYRVEGGH